MNKENKNIIICNKQILTYEKINKVNNIERETNLNINQIKELENDINILNLKNK